MENRLECYNAQLNSMQFNWIINAKMLAKFRLNDELTFAISIKNIAY